MATTKIKLGFFSTLVIAGVAVSVWQHQKNERLESENTTLRQQSLQSEIIRGDNRRLTENLTEETQRPQSDNRELLRLRGQVGVLGKAVQDNPRLQAELKSLAAKLAQAGIEPGADKPKDPEAEMLGRKMILASVWGHALLRFAEKHDGQMPLTLEAATPYLTGNEQSPFPAMEKVSAEAAKDGVGIEQFELTYQGSSTNLQSPSETFLMREKDPFRAKDGKWGRTYVRADGMAWTIYSDDGDFTGVEQGRVFRNQP
jgi:hypothetical protein